MIGIFKGSHVNLQRSNRGFVVLHHELIPFLKQFTGSEWLVLTCLALRADETGYSFPSVSLICDDTGLSERIVRQAIKTLSTATVERPKAVLAVEERHVESGRRTTNGYVILPDGFGEGAKTTRGEGAKTAREEGAKNAGVITLKNIHKEVDTPIVPTKGTKRDSIKMPVDDDPAKALYLAYRSVVFTDLLMVTAFMLGEWRGAHHVLRSMQAAGVTPGQVEYATRNLVAKWGGRRDMVTINALWKHWSTAISENVQQNTISKASSMVDELWD
jgi:hypothetical protein